MQVSNGDNGSLKEFVFVCDGGKLHQRDGKCGMPIALREHDWAFETRWPLPAPSGGHATQVQPMTSVTLFPTHAIDRDVFPAKHG